QALDQLISRHLETENANRVTVLDRGAIGDTEGKRRLTHGRTGGENKQVRTLQSSRHLVEVLEPGRDADNIATMLLQIVDLLEVPIDHIRDRLEILCLSLLRHLEQRALGGVQRIFGFDLVLEADPDDLCPGLDQPPACGLAGDDVAGVVDVDRSRHGVEVRREVGDPTALLEELPPYELIRERDEVGRLTLVVEIENGAIDQSIGVDVEVLWLEIRRNLDDGIAVDQKASEDRLFCFDIVWGKPIDGRLHAGSPLLYEHPMNVLYVL